MNKKLYLTVLFCFLLIQSYGTEYYCNPSTGSMSNSGTSESQPWGTLEAVFSANKVFSPGDIIYLMTGHHGSPTIKGTNTDYVTIQPLQGQAPSLKNVTFSAAKKWKLYGLTISPETAPSYSRIRLVDISSNSTDNIIDNCFMYSVSDNSGWTTESDWTTNCCSGLRIQGVDNIVRNSKFLNIWNAVIVAKGANRCLFEKNVIENYMEDGIRGLADNCIFQYNTVKNSYGIGTYHEDGFQSWSVGTDGQVGSGVVYGIVLRGNTFIDFTKASQPFKRTSNNHAIGIYDGMAENWIIENNTVVFNGFNGIVIQGATNCKIVNNTVIKNPINVSAQLPYISVENHDNGTLSSGNIVRNNLASDYYRLYGCVADHNITTTDYDSYFVDYMNYDLHLKPQAPAIDQGTPDDAPLVDIEGNSRPFGNGYDVGAYESLISPPGITTSIATSISANSAVLGGNVSDSNGASVTERGIVYSTTNSPTIDIPGVTKVSSGTGTGVFSESIGTLSPVTTYYVQAYAINSAGTSYGGAQSFTTSKSDQTIMFDPLSVKTYSDVDFNLSATSSSGLIVSYTISDPNIAVIVGNLVHIVGTGTCTIFTDQAGNETYNAAAQASQTLTVNKAELTVTADAQTKVYGDVNPVLTYQYSGWKNGEDASVLTTTPTISTTVTATTSVGTYTDMITVSGGAAANYTFTYVPADFNVTAATLIVTADAKTKVYGEANPVLTYQYSGWKNGEDASVLTAIPTISTTVTNTTSVGTYTDAITVSGGAAANYTFTYVPASFTVNKATVIVWLDNKVKEYGQDNPALTYRYTGFMNGDDESVLDSKPYPATTVTKFSDAGVYPNSITLVGGRDDKYIILSVPATFTVTKAKQQITFDKLTPKTYGDAPFTLSATSTSGATLTFICSDPNVAYVSGNTVNITGTGTATVVVSQSGTLNVEGATATQTLTVTPKVINVTAQSVNIECNEADQELRYIFEPELKTGDSFKGELTRTTGSAPGVYPISQGTLTLGNNYSIIFNGANYTIANTKNSPPIVDFVADQQAPKNSKEAIITLTGIDPVSNCIVQEIESIVAMAENKTLIPDIQVEYTKGQPSAKLKVKIADNLVGETKISVQFKDNGGTQNEGTDTSEITFMFKVEIPTGIDDLNQNTNVVIYPNPSDGIVNIKYSGFNDPAIRVFKVTGEEMVKFTKLSKLTLPLNLSGYSADVYFVEISENKNTVVKKLIIN